MCGNLESWCVDRLAVLKRSRLLHEESAARFGFVWGRLADGGGAQACKQPRQVILMAFFTTRHKQLLQLFNIRRAGFCSRFAPPSALHI
jgi:hypothetical protein